MSQSMRSLAISALVAGLVVLTAGLALGGVTTARAAGAASPVEFAEDAYRSSLDRLHAYLSERCGPSPNARSCDWGVYHQYGALTHGAVVTGATTSESQNLALAFETLYGHLSGDRAPMSGILAYIRSVTMPHDGMSDPPASFLGRGEPYFPVLTHWLVEVDGGTWMGATGTRVGPNTPYLAHESRGAGIPVVPDPDRECWRSPDDYKYVSAPDADQWLLNALEIAYALGGEAEHRELAARIEASLEHGLAMPRDFRYGIFDDFERDWRDDWWTYLAGRMAALRLADLGPGAEGTTSAMSVTYAVPWTAYAGVASAIDADWTGSEGLRLWFGGDGRGNVVRLQIAEALSSTAATAAAQAPAYEYFEHMITDTVRGWRQIEVPFEAFRERESANSDWETTGNNVLDLDGAETLAFEPLPATFADDFEPDSPGDWWYYEQQFDAIDLGRIAPGADGTGQALGVTYTVASGYCGFGATPNADWTGHDALAFDLRGAATQNDLVVGLAERGGEIWHHVLRDESAAWRPVTIPLAVSDAGFAHGEWQPEGADVDGTLDLAEIADLSFEPTPGWFTDDFDNQDVSDWWSYRSEDGTTVEISPLAPGASGTTGALRLRFAVRSGGWAGAGKSVDGDFRPYDGLSVWLKGDGAVRLVVKDAEDEGFGYEVGRLRPLWTEVRLRWPQLSALPDQAGNRRLDLENVRAIIVESSEDGDAEVDVDQLSVTADGLGSGTLALDNVRLTGGSPRTGHGAFQADEIRLVGAPLGPIYPGVMQFSLQWDQNGSLPWLGPLYTAYQDPAAYCLAGDGATSRAMVAFLGAAQDAYDAQAPGTDNHGPFMPLFVQDPAYGSDGRMGWTWDGSKADANTGWAQFQYRAFARLAQYWYLSGDRDAAEILTSFERWLAAHTETDPSGRVTAIPVELVPGTEDVRPGYRPGDFALAAQGMLYVSAASRSEERLAVARALLDALIERQDAEGAFPSEGARFGYEQAEAGIALSLFELLGGPDGAARDARFALLGQRGCVQLDWHTVAMPSLSK